MSSLPEILILGRRFTVGLARLPGPSRTRSDRSLWAPALADIGHRRSRICATRLIILPRLNRHRCESRKPAFQWPSSLPCAPYVTLLLVLRSESELFIMDPIGPEPLSASTCQHRALPIQDMRQRG